MSGTDTRERTAFIPAALDDAPLNPYELSLMVAIYRRAGKDGVFNESLAKVAERKGIPQKAIYQAMKGLLELGMVTLLSSGPGMPKCYRPAPQAEWKTEREQAAPMPRVKTMPAPIQPEIPAQEMPAPVSMPTMQPVQASESTLQPNADLVPITTKPRKPAKPKPDYEAYRQFWNDNTPQHWAKCGKMTDTRQKHVNKLVKDFGVDESYEVFQKAVLYAASDERWWLIKSGITMENIMTNGKTASLAEKYDAKQSVPFMNEGNARLAGISASIARALEGYDYGHN